MIQFAELKFLPLGASGTLNSTCSTLSIWGLYSQYFSWAHSLRARNQRELQEKLSKTIKIVVWGMYSLSGYWDVSAPYQMSLHWRLYIEALWAFSWRSYFVWHTVRNWIAPSLHLSLLETATMSLLSVSWDFDLYQTNLRHSVIA